MKLHYLTEAGLECFERYLVALRNEPLLSPPREILEDLEFATPLEGSVELHEMAFPSRMEAARFLHSVLAPISDPERNKGLWAWLSLFFFDAVCPIDGNGHRKPGELPRHVPEVGNYQRYYRHLLLGPYLIHRFFSKNPDAALSLLWQPVHKPGDIVGQLAARQELVTNFGAIEAATRLYYDPATKRERRGAQSKERGGARRLADILNQLDVTWDLYGMQATEIDALLPKEFDKFRSKAA